MTACVAKWLVSPWWTCPSHDDDDDDDDTDDDEHDDDVSATPRVSLWFEVQDFIAVFKHKLWNHLFSRIRLALTDKFSSRCHTRLYFTS